MSYPPWGGAGFSSLLTTRIYDTRPPLPVSYQESERWVCKWVEEALLTMGTALRPTFLTTSRSKTGRARMFVKENPVAAVGGMSPFRMPSRLSQLLSFPIKWQAWQSLC